MLIIIYLFLFIGIITILLNKKINKIYIFILVFLLLKTIFNYRKCTMSYIECKVRDVKKENGYINNLLNQIINIRDKDEIVFIYIYSFLIIYYYYSKL